MSVDLRSFIVESGVLSVAVQESGPADGPAVLLLHGFPYDVHAYDAVAARVAAAGCRVIVPFLRGFGPTRLRDPQTPKSGQQAALGADLLALLDTLGIGRAVLAGYDWGGRAACIVSALWPHRVAGLVSVTGYTIQDLAAAPTPRQPEAEHRLWYQYYFHSERGRAGLSEDRRAVCRLLWQLWSPDWHFDPATFERSAAAFDNPDFVDIVIHSYRHRFGLMAGDPAYTAIEAQLSRQPMIGVPAIVLHGGSDGVDPACGSAGAARHFAGPYERRVLPGIGHNLPQEAPEEMAAAVSSLVKRATGSRV